MFTFKAYFEENKLCSNKLFLSFICIDFAEPNVFLVGPYAFLQPYHSDAYDPHMGHFFFTVFQGNSAQGPTGHMVTCVTALSQIT